MTQGLGFLLAMLLEGAAAAVLGWWIAPRLDLSRFSASVRLCAASVIGTGVTHPALWLWLKRLVELSGSWWAGVAAGLCLVILIELMVYAAVLRGHWRLSLALSAFLNAASFGMVILVNWTLTKPT